MFYKKWFVYCEPFFLFKIFFRKKITTFYHSLQPAAQLMAILSLLKFVTFNANHLLLLKLLP